MHEASTNCMSTSKWDKPSKYEQPNFSPRWTRSTTCPDWDAKRIGPCKDPSRAQLKQAAI